MFSVAQLGARTLRCSRMGSEQLQQRIHCHPAWFSWLPRSIIKHRGEKSSLSPMLARMRKSNENESDYSSNCCFCAGIRRTT